MQDQLIPVSQSAVGSETIQTVNARDLYAFLGVKDDFSTWIKGRVESFDFVENQDFVTFPENSGKGRPRIEYALSLDMAKELSMVERNAKGKEARQYFIECERRAKSASALPTDPMSLLKLSLAVHEEQSKRLSAVEEQVQFINDNVRLHQWQQYELKLAVNTLAYDFHKRFGVELKQLYPGIWNKLKVKMQVSSYSAIPAIKFDEALSFVKGLSLKDLPDYVQQYAMGGVA